MIKTYSQSFVPNSLIFEMAKESSQIYNRAIQLHKERVHFREFGKIIDKEVQTKYLICESKQAAYQQFCKDFTLWDDFPNIQGVTFSNFEGTVKTNS